MSERTAGSLFTGIGGWDYALRAAGANVAWACECEAFPASVVRRRFGVDVLPDVRALDGGTPPVDVLAGGFPCQDLSLAGRGAGIYGDRSGLWWEFARLIADLRPRLVLIENVPALRRRGLGALLRGLHDLGYDAEWDGIPASAVGAPHRRDRIWIIAYPTDTAAAPVAFGDPTGLFPIASVATAVEHDAAGWPRAGMTRNGDVLELDPVAPLDARVLWPTPCASKWSQGAGSGWGLRRAVDAAALWPTPKASPSGPDYARAGRDRSGGDDLATAAARHDPGPLNPTWVEWLMGFPLGWTDLSIDAPAARPWDDEPLPRTAPDVPNRTARLTALGNALVPAVAFGVAHPALAALCPETSDV